MIASANIIVSNSPATDNIEYFVIEFNIFFGIALESRLQKYSTV